MERQIEGNSVVFIIRNQLHSSEANLLCSADYIFRSEIYDSQHPLHAQQS